MLTFVDVQYGLTSHFKHSTAFHWIERNFLHCHSWSLHLPRPYESKHNIHVCMHVTMAMETVTTKETVRHISFRCGLEKPLQQASVSTLFPF